MAGLLESWKTEVQTSLRARPGWARTTWARRADGRAGHGRAGHSGAQSWKALEGHCRAQGWAGHSRAGHNRAARPCPAQPRLYLGVGAQL